jgi:hypothetical protein
MIEWTAFRDAPIEQVRAVAPDSVMLASAGTRRAAMLAGVQLDSLERYFRWGMDQIDRAARAWFAHGVRDLFICFIRSSQAREIGAYRDGLTSLGAVVLGDILRTHRQNPPPYAVRSFGVADFPELAEPVGTIVAATADPNKPRLWWTFSATPFSPYQHALAALGGQVPADQRAAIDLVYGAEVAPCRLYVGFGKPILTAELQLPFLIDEANAVWYQIPGYSGLSSQVIRRIIYEGAYARRTWAADKSGRYDTVLDNRDTWQQPRVLGLGSRLGKFWYPDASLIE